MARTNAADQDLDEACRFTDEYTGLRLRLRSERLQPIAAAFEANLDRVRSMASMIYVIAFWADQMARHECQARHLIGVAPDDPSKDATPAMGAALEKVYDEFITRRAALGYDGANLDTWTKGARALAPVLAIKDERLPSGSTHPVGRGISSLLGSMVSQAYGIYETLAVDIWIEALNANTSLGKNWFEARVNQNRNKTYQVSELLDHDFSLVGKIGTWLHRTNKASFLSLKDLRTNYEAAFGDAVRHVLEPMTELSATEKVRHLLAHRGGIVDERFLQDMSDHPVYGNTKVGDRVPLDGLLVRDHVAACAAGGTALAGWVDWFLEKGSGT